MTIVHLSGWVLFWILFTFYTERISKFLFIPLLVEARDLWPQRLLSGLKNSGVNVMISLTIMVEDINWCPNILESLEKLNQLYAPAGRWASICAYLSTKPFQSLLNTYMDIITEGWDVWTKRKEVQPQRLPPLTLSFRFWAKTGSLEVLGWIPSLHPWDSSQHLGLSDNLTSKIWAGATSQYRQMIRWGVMPLCN